MFVGRNRELDRLEDHLLQTSAGKPGAFIITGERGIGKSSLLLYISVVARGLPTGGRKLNFLVIHTDLDQTTTQLGLVRKIELGLRKRLEADEKGLSCIRKTWEFLQRLEAGGISLRDADSNLPLETLIEESAYSLASTINSITSDRTASDWGLAKVYDGVLLLIDEADNASPQLNLGAFLKLLLERVQRSDCHRLAIGLAGLPRVCEILLKSHESSLRLFEEIQLGPLTEEETGQVLDIGLEEANQKNSVSVSIEPDARSLLTYLAEGFPHFIQQFAFSAFDRDDDGIISTQDVWNSALGDGGALDLIGKRYYRDAFYNKIKQDSYRQVLRIMASQKSEWITKAELRQSFKGKTTTLDNALHALSDRNIILRKQGALGTYRLLHRGFALWIKIFTDDPERIKQLSLGQLMGSKQSSS
jgi:hypothetical protein